MCMDYKPLTNWDAQITFHHFSWVKFSIVPASSTASPASAVLSLPKAMARWRDLSRGKLTLTPCSLGVSKNRFLVRNFDSFNNDVEENIKTGSIN